MRNKRGEGYIRAAIMILIFCIMLSVFMSFILSVNLVRISKKTTYKVIDGFVTQNSIEAFNSIKVGTDYIEELNSTEFKDYFCEYNDLTDNGSSLISYTNNGVERYRIKDLDIKFIEDKTLKLQVTYKMIIPISFGDIAVSTAIVPITVNSKLTDKFS